MHATQRLPVLGSRRLNMAGKARSLEKSVVHQLRLNRGNLHPYAVSRSTRLQEVTAPVCGGRNCHEKMSYPFRTCLPARRHKAGKTSHERVLRKDVKRTYHDCGIHYHDFSQPDTTCHLPDQAQYISPTQNLFTRERGVGDNENGYVDEQCSDDQVP